MAERMTKLRPYFNLVSSRYFYDFSLGFTLHVSRYYIDFCVGLGLWEMYFGLYRAR
jgi:hypothetical protein